uniref:Uncharacterized protein n=1 Tax=Romanomermis culicivorax TaxID=13658 RepID=A0A915KBU9_ROMCU
MAQNDNGRNGALYEKMRVISKGLREKSSATIDNAQQADILVKSLVDQCREWRASQEELERLINQILAESGDAAEEEKVRKSRRHRSLRRKQLHDDQEQKGSRRKHSKKSKSGRYLTKYKFVATMRFEKNSPAIEPNKINYKLMADGSPNRRSGRRYNNTSHNYSNNGNFLVDDDPRRSPEAGEKLLFERFENVASSVTKLYNAPSWPMFQQAAAAITLFYKDNVDSYRRGLDHGVQTGRQMLCKDLLAAIQLSGHPYIRRDDCIDLILNLTSSSALSTSSSANGSTVTMTTSPQSSLRSSPPRCADAATMCTEDAPQDSSMALVSNLETFGQALNSPLGLTTFFVDECRRHQQSKRRRPQMDDDDESWDERVQKWTREIFHVESKLYVGLWHINLAAIGDHLAGQWSSLNKK